MTVDELNPLEDDHVYWLIFTFVCGILLYFIVLRFVIPPANGKQPGVKATNTLSGQKYDCEVIVVGSGILGSALAATLGKDGRNVIVIERDLKEPDRIVGELLQPGGVEALNKLGLAECTDSIDAHTVKGYLIHNNCANTQVQIPYPSANGKVKEGRSFHHGKFITALRNSAKDISSVKYVEGTVTKLKEEDGIITGVSYKDKDNGEIVELKAPLTIVADGCFSKLRKGLVKQTPTVKSYFAGMLMKDCPQTKDNYAELVLADPNPILIYRISSRCTRILVDIRGGLPKNIKDYFRESVCTQLPEHMQGPFLDALETERIRSMPNSFLPPVPLEKLGVLCLGDALNMRHPLTGGGMSVALNDVIIVRQLLQHIPDLRENSAVTRAARTLYMRRKTHHSFVVNVLAQALYELFAADDEYLQRLKAACFAYFQLGGECVAGPVGLLSVLNPKPHVLLCHFFAVAMYAIYFTFQTEGWYSVHRAIRLSLGIFGSALRVITPLVWSELKTIIKY